jgi:hypothetical protein
VRRAMIPLRVFQGEWFRIERWRRVSHVEIVLSEAEDVLADLGVGAGDQGVGDGVSARGHVRQDCGHFGDVGQHDHVGGEAGIYFSCFSCSTGSPLLITGPPNETQSRKSL